MNKTLIGIITLAALATVAHAQFTEIGNPQHYGKINIPKAYGVIDANFAQIAGGTADVTLTTDKLWVGNDSSNQTAMAVIGAVTLTQDGTDMTTVLTDKAVTYAKIQDVAGLSVVGRAGDTEGVSAAITGTDGQVLRVAGTTLGFGEIAEAGIADGAVTAAKTHATVQTSLLQADLLTRETASDGAILALPEGTGNGTHKVTIAAPASLTDDRTITVPDADVVLANIAVAVGKVNDLIDYLGDGLWVIGTMANSTTPNKFKTTTAAAYSIGGISYAKNATDDLEFSQADTINAGGETNTFYGSWVIQINAAGAVSTLADTGQSGAIDMAYTSAEDALTAAQAVTLTASNVALGYLVVAYDATGSGDEGGTWTANSSALDTNATATYTDGDVKALPAKIE